MKFLCIFGHKYKIMNFDNYWDVSWGDKAPSYTLIKMCMRCGKYKNEHSYGHGFFTNEMRDQYNSIQ